MKGYRFLFWYSVAVGVIVALMLLCSCKQVEYVPVEIVKKEYVHTTDTLRQTDTLRHETNTILREARPEDSVMLAKLGIKLSSQERLLILLQQELSETKSELQESHFKDSVRVDSVQVPYPVERKLSRWEKFRMDFGTIAIGVSLILIVFVAVRIAMWIRKFRTI